MKFGIMFANTGHGSSPEGATAVATAAEAGGFEAIWTVEHVVVPSGYESKYPYDPSGKMAGGAEDFDLPDPLIWLTWAAANSTTLRLGTGILIATQRNPLITATAKVGIRPIAFRHERGAVMAADGYSRVSDGKRIGVVAMQSQAGAENSAGGLAQANQHLGLLKTAEGL